MSTETNTHSHKTTTETAPQATPASETASAHPKVTKAHHDDNKEVKAQQAHLEFPIKDIIPEKNVRTGALPDIQGLAETIKSVGILEPLLGVPAADGKITLVAGYRRYFAAKSAGLKTVPVRLISVEESKRLDVALIENLQRADLNALDKANAMQKMIEGGLDQKEVASRLGVSPGYVSQHLGLLKLPKKAQDHVAKGKLELTHARELMRVKDDELVESLLDDAEALTASELKNKVDFLLEKERAKEEKKKEAAPAKKKAAGKEGEKTEAAPRKSLAERYADEELEPLKKNDLREQLQVFANKLERAESENKRLEYKFILKGLEIAAGLKG